MFPALIAKSPLAVVVTAALDEARRRGDRRMGTEHLLLGLLHVPDAAPARALGVDLESAREALEALDNAALRALGIDFGQLVPGDPATRRHPPVTLSALTSGARSAVKRCIAETTAKTRATAPTRLLLILLTCQHPDPVAQLLSQLRLEPSAVRDRLVPAGPG
jgi:hypothetical protein